MGGMQFQTTVTCDSCRGSGKIIKNPCSNCRGTGYVRITKKLSVDIPAGINEGERIALRSQGSEGRNGGPAGDLIIQISIQPHKIFKRDGYNVYCDVPVTVAEATLGAKIDIPTLEGSYEYEIPEGTQPGTQFTLRGKGIQYLNYPNRKGDLIFTAVVEIPKGLSSKQKENMRIFAESCGESNYNKKTSFFKSIKNIFDKK